MDEVEILEWVEGVPGPDNQFCYHWFSAQGLDGEASLQSLHH